MGKINDLKERLGVWSHIYIYIYLIIYIYTYIYVSIYMSYVSRLALAFQKPERAQPRYP